MSVPLTVVMYHYVRQLEETAYPHIKGRRTTEFHSQLHYLKKHYTIVGIERIVEYLETGTPLPTDAALLTFDDGYRDHYENVFPILRQHGLPGAFFPPVRAVECHELLDVNRIHFLLASVDPTVLGREVDAQVQDARDAFDLAEPSIYRERLAVPSRFDPAETIYVKRMLQRALPEVVRHWIARDLFRRYVSNNEHDFAAELYATRMQLEEMQANGMYIGAHGNSHYWLDALNPTEQETEIRASIEFLRQIRSPVDKYWVMCYPYGSYNAALLNSLRKMACKVGLTTEVRQADLASDDPLLLPRFDTNDFPTSL